MAQKKILFINRQPPFNTLLAQEALDILLMASTFDQHISVAFVDVGIYQLKKNQQPEQVLTKNFSVTFKALSVYDIKNIYVEKESLQSCGLTADDLLIPVTLKNTVELSAIIQQQDIIFNC